MALLSEYSLWFILVCVAIGAAYSLILYFKNRSVIFERRSLWVMALLRGITMTMITFLFLAPMVRLNLKQTDKPILLFAVDNSESVAAGKDSSYYRQEYQDQLNSLINTFGNQYEIITGFVGEQNRFQKSGDETLNPDFTDKTTDLSSVFDEVNNFYGNRNMGAMVLFTDGIFNTGSNPYYKADKLNFPVYTVGLGDTEFQPDLLISGINHNRQTYRGNFFPVEIKVAANKLAGKNSVLRVYEQGTEIFSKNINLNSSQYFETVKLSIEAREKGMHQYRVELEEVDGEISYKNNVASFFVEVVDTREKIAIIYHAPHPDISALRYALEKIDRYELDVFPVQEFKANPEDYSLLILHQLPSAINPVSTLLSRITQGGISALFIMGQQTDLSRFNTMNLGMTITQNRGLFNDAVPSYNENFTSFTFSEETRQIIRNFPPLHTFFGDYKTAVSATTFMYQKISNVITPYPLIMFNDLNGAKMGVITGDGLWQWRMYNYLYAQNSDAFDEIITKTVQLLSVKSDKSFFRVHAGQVFDENADIEFSAELYNDSYELVNEPDVTFSYTDRAGKKYDSRFSKQNNAYSLNLGKLPVGDYSWQASVQFGNQTYAKNGIFTVREVMLESVNLVADHALLQNISQATNGKFFTVDRMQDVEQEIKNNDNIKAIANYSKKYSLIMNSWWYLALIILLLGVEWFMRKWGGGY